MAYHHAKGFSKEQLPPSTNIGILSWPANQSFDRCLNHQTGGHPRQSSQREPWPWPTFLHGRRVVGHRGSCLQRGNGACLTDDGQIICGRHFGRTNQRGLGPTKEMDYCTNICRHLQAAWNQPINFGFSGDLKIEPWCLVEVRGVPLMSGTCLLFWIHWRQQKGDEVE